MPPSHIKLAGAGILQFSGDLDELIVQEMNFVMRQMPNAEKETNFQPAFVIVFGKGQPFEGRPVVSSLVDIVGEVERSVSDLIGAYLSQP